MSLVSMIDKNVSFRDILVKAAPSKKYFSTNTGDKPFSNRSEVKVPYSLKDFHNAGLVGTAADYMFRFSVAKVISDNKYDAIENLIAETAIAQLKGNVEETLYKKVRTYFYDGKETIREYIDGVITNKYQIAKIALGFSYLDNYYRSFRLPQNIDEMLECKNQELINDVVKLTIVFEETFISGGIVHTDSYVVFNPHFGKWGSKCGGADADIYIDGTLYDFKCTKDAWCNDKEILQLYGYYLLHEICRQDENDKEISWIKKDINSIAIYKGRHGVINSCILDRSTADISPEIVDQVKKLISAREAKEQELIENLATAVDNVRKSLKPDLKTKEVAINNPSASDNEKEESFFTFYLLKRNIYTGGVSSTEKYVKNRSRVYYPFKGTGTVVSAYILGNEAFVEIKFDKDAEISEIRCIDFFANAYIICEDEPLKEGKKIYSPNHGYGYIKRMEKKGEFTEIAIGLKFNREQVFINELTPCYIVEKPKLVINSSRLFPYSSGKVILDSRYKVDVVGFVKNNGITEIKLSDDQGRIEMLPLGDAALRLSVEMPREDIIIRDYKSNGRIFINDSLKVGTEIVIERKSQGNVIQNIGKITEIKKGTIYVVLVVCNDNKRIRIFGGY